MHYTYLIYVLCVGFAFAGCSAGLSSTSSKASDPSEQYLANKTKWEEAKSSISRYKLVETQVAASSWSTIEIVVDQKTDTAESCKLTRSVYGVSSTEDCLHDPVASTRVETYFSALEDLLVKGAVSSVSFDSRTGAPIQFRASDDPACVDCLSSSRGISLTVLE